MFWNQGYMNEERTAGSHRMGLSATLDLTCNIRAKAATDHLMGAKSVEIKIG